MASPFFLVIPLYSKTPEEQSKMSSILEQVRRTFANSSHTSLAAIQGVEKSRHNCLHVISECPSGKQLCEYMEAPCDEERAHRLFSLLLGGVAELHLMGLSHGCLSLDNVYFDEGANRLQISDWFLCQARGKSLSHLGDVQRTGVLLVQLLTGSIEHNVSTSDDVDAVLDGALFDMVSNDLKGCLRVCLQGKTSAQSLLALPYLSVHVPESSWRLAPFLQSSEPSIPSAPANSAVKLWENSRLPPEDHLKTRIVGSLKRSHHRQPVLLRSSDAPLKLPTAWKSTRISVEELRNAAYVSPPQNDIKESIERQRERVAFFRVLLEGGDRAAIRAASQGGIPPSMRLQVWELLLEVDANEAAAEWEQLDRESPHPSDHQIEVDVPRCQSRHPTLGTTLGREKLTNVLKAWVVAHQDLEYWQGLDSLCAPFVALSYDNDCRAYAMLTKLVQRFLHGMFLQRNTSKLQTQLVIFSQLLAFHDPELANHMENFKPELYAIPWFLTLFTHILPISSVYKLWDFLMIHDAVVIHHISLAFIRQLRPQLMELDFDGMVLYFSQLKSSTAINLQMCIKDAIRYGKMTPPSLCASGDSGERADSRKWWQLPVQLHVLREEMSPRMSPQDFIRLQQDATERQRIVTVFDTRPAAEFAAVRVRHSINLKAKECQLKSLASRKGALIVVIAPKNKESKLTNRLVLAGFPKVVALAGGMEALKHMRADCLVKGDKK